MDHDSDDARHELDTDATPLPDLASAFLAALDGDGALPPPPEVRLEAALDLVAAIDASIAESSAAAAAAAAAAAIGAAGTSEPATTPSSAPALPSAFASQNPWESASSSLALDLAGQLDAEVPQEPFEPFALLPPTGDGGPLTSEDADENIAAEAFAEGDEGAAFGEGAGVAQSEDLFAGLDTLADDDFLAELEAAAVDVASAEVAIGNEVALGEEAALGEEVALGDAVPMDVMPMDTDLLDVESLDTESLGAESLGVVAAFVEEPALDEPAFDEPADNPFTTAGSFGDDLAIAEPAIEEPAVVEMAVEESAVEESLADDTSSDAPLDLEEFIVFSLADTRCVVPIRNVVEVGRIPDAAAVPNAPAWLHGLGNLRGQVLSLIDLRAFLGLGRIRPSAGRMIVLRADADEVVAGLMVDQVHQIVSLSPSRFQTAPATLPPGFGGFVWGVCDYGTHTMVGLDVDSVLGAEVEQAETTVLTV